MFGYFLTHKPPRPARIDQSHVSSYACPSHLKQNLDLKLSESFIIQEPGAHKKFLQVGIFAHSTNPHTGNESHPFHSIFSISLMTRAPLFEMNESLQESNKCIPLPIKTYIPKNKTEKKAQFCERILNQKNLCIPVVQLEYYESKSGPNGQHRFNQLP